MKRTIVMNLLLVCLAALMIGMGTSAYFSDSAASTDNLFQAGTMDFRIADPATLTNQLFNATNLKPGDSATAFIAVVNDSTPNMDMKWRAWVGGFDSGILDDVLEVRVILHPSSGYDYSGLAAAGYTIAGPGDRLITDWTPITNLANGNTILEWAPPAAVAFEPGWAAVYRLDVRVSATAGNAYQGSSFTGDINFAATQYENPGW